MALMNDAHLLAEGERKIARTFQSFLSQTGSWLTHLRDLWIARRRRARELDDLYRLSDRELMDLGLSRSDFPAIERGIYRRD